MFTAKALGRFLADLIALGMFPERELKNVPEGADWHDIEGIWVWTNHPEPGDCLLLKPQSVRRASGINAAETGFVYEVHALIGQGGFDLVIRWEQLIEVEAE